MCVQGVINARIRETLVLFMCTKKVLYYFDKQELVFVIPTACSYTRHYSKHKERGKRKVSSYQKKNRSVRLFQFLKRNTSRVR